MDAFLGRPIHFLTTFFSFFDSWVGASGSRRPKKAQRALKERGQLHSDFLSFSCVTRADEPLTLFG